MGKKKVYKRPFNYGWRFIDYCLFLPLVSISIVIALIFMVVIFGIGELWNEIEFQPGTVTASGRIDSCQEVHAYKNTYCEATVSFKTQSGQLIQFYDNAGSSKEGDTVVVWYHPDNPEDARIDNLPDWLISIGFGVCLLPVDLLLFWCWKRRRAREDAKSQPHWVKKRDKRRKYVRGKRL